jgi:glutamyl-tRNA synthetase
MRRVLRYAPSPTGALHLGGLRTALYGALLARAPPSPAAAAAAGAATPDSGDGVFLLRIEDTDRRREVAGAADGLADILHWAGLRWDAPPPWSPLGKELNANKSSREALGVRPDGAVVQSVRARAGVYSAAAEQLVATGAAYRCFCPQERLAQFRAQQGRRGAPAVYDRLCASLSPSDVQARLARGDEHVVRLFVPPGETTFTDSVRGRQSFRHDHIDDQILLKSDGFPTYHLANVVDDRASGVTHVVRGEEWVASTPKHILLYGALGWGDALPEFAHLPLLANPDGTKLSKRQGDVSVESFRDAGFLPSALLNYVAMLGWTPPGEREVYFDPLREIPRDFDVARVHRNAAVVSRDKLRWFNAQHLRHMAAETDVRSTSSGGGGGGGGDGGGMAALVTQLRHELAHRATFSVPPRADLARDCYDSDSDAHLEAVLRCIKDRVSLVRDVPELCAYFWVDPDMGKAEQLPGYAKLWRAGDASVLFAFASEALWPLVEDDAWTAEAINERAGSWCKEHGLKLPQLWKPLRFAVTGTDVGAGVPQTMETLGAATVVRRVSAATDTLV